MHGRRGGYDDAGRRFRRAGRAGGDAPRSARAGKRPALHRRRAGRQIDRRRLRLRRRRRASSTKNSAPAPSPRVDGNKLTVDFDKAGRKMVLDSFVQGAG